MSGGNGPVRVLTPEEIAAISGTITPIAMIRHRPTDKLISADAPEFKRRGFRSGQNETVQYIDPREL